MLLPFPRFCTTKPWDCVPREKGDGWWMKGLWRWGDGFPVNPSGGLLSRGHPVGATGVAQIVEVVTQLRHEAGPPAGGRGPGRPGPIAWVETRTGTANRARSPSFPCNGNMGKEIMTKVHHVALFVADMDRARYLFQDILGFEPAWHAPMVKGNRISTLLGIPDVQMEIAYLQNGPGNTAVELCRMIPPVKNRNPKAFGSPGTASLSLNVENLDQLHKRLTREGWKPFSPLPGYARPRRASDQTFLFSSGRRNYSGID